MSVVEHQADLSNPCADTTLGGVFALLRCLRCCDQRRGLWVTLQGLPELGETYALSTGGTMEVLRVSYAVAADAKVYLGPEVMGVEASGEPYVARFCCTKTLGCLVATLTLPDLDPFSTMMYVQVGLSAPEYDLDNRVWVKLLHHDGEVFWFDWRRDISAFDDYVSGPVPERNQPYQQPLCVLPLGVVSPLQNTPSANRVTGVTYADGAPAALDVLPVGLNSDGSGVLIRARDGGYNVSPTADDPDYCLCAKQRIPSKVWVTVSGLSGVCTFDSHLTFAEDSLVVEVPLFEGAEEPDQVCYLVDGGDDFGFYNAQVTGLELAACGEGENLCMEEGSPSGTVEVYVDHNALCYFEDYNVRLTVIVTLACSAEPGSVVAYAREIYFHFDCATGIVPAPTDLSADLITLVGSLNIGTITVNLSHEPPP